MASAAIFIWPIGAEKPFISSSMDELLKFLSDQRRAWTQINRSPTDNADFTKYIDDATGKILYFKDLLHRAVSEEVTTQNVALDQLTYRSVDERSMWLDASSHAGRQLLDILRIGPRSQAENLETQLRKHWNASLLDWANRFVDTARPANLRLQKEHKDTKLIAAYQLERTNAREMPEAQIRTVINKAIEEIKIAARLEREMFEGSLAQARETASSAIIQDLKQAKDELVSIQSVVVAKIAEDRLSLRSLAESLSGALEEQKAAVASLTTVLDKNSALIPKIESELADMATKIAAQIEASAAAIKSHEDAHRGQLVLRAPIAYWSRKRVLHYSFAGAAFFVFVGVIVLGAYGVFSNFGPISTHLKEIQQSHGEGIFNLTGLAIISMPSIAFFWILKHISRLFVDNLAQASDAGQRSVMMQTYLALVAEPSAKVSEPERLLVLNALFRPSAVSGSDDAPPSNLMDLLTKSAEPKKS